MNMAIARKIRKIKIARRRDEITQSGREALAAYRTGELKSYTAAEAITELRNMLDSPE
jgi:hypothetical protein